MNVGRCTVHRVCAVGCGKMQTTRCWILNSNSFDQALNFRDVFCNRLLTSNDCPAMLRSDTARHFIPAPHPCQE